MCNIKAKIKRWSWGRASLTRVPRVPGNCWILDFIRWHLFLQVPHLGVKTTCGTLDFDILTKTLNMHILNSQIRGLGFRIEEYQTCILWPIFLANNAIAENNQNMHILWYLIPVEELTTCRFWMAYKGVTQNPSSKYIVQSPSKLYIWLLNMPYVNEIFLKE